MFRRIVLVVAAVVGLATAGACSSVPEVPEGAGGRPDPVLVEGRDVYSAKCKSCHDTDGSGERGPSLLEIDEKYPSIDDQIAVITEGKGGGMPSFGDTISADEIVAVARYVREVLAA